MQALGIGPGDEVIVPSMTFVASANAVVHTGADVVLVDCEPGTGLIDLDAAEAAISERTRALLIVHLAGAAGRHGARELDSRPSRAADRGGRGARTRRRAGTDVKIGAHGNLTAYSFYVTKNITTVEGGAVVTDDPALAERGRAAGAPRAEHRRCGSATATAASCTTRSSGPATSTT